ncbi:MAG: lipopolysaccharide biosynthesis protein [Propionibacteriaceae bacterium]|jgi:PST family polysaccharide transporter|nr:lipopolysaccharide biosynthesis protein [Propionibacteriaceae bacterium]
MAASSFGARAGAILLGGQWIKYVIQLVALVVLSRMLPKSDFGIVAIVTAIVAVAATVGDLGLSTAALQAPVLSHEQKSNLFWLNTGCGFVFTSALFFAAPLVADIYDQPELRWVCRVLAFLFVVAGIGAQFRVEGNRTGSYSRVALADVLGGVIGVLGALILAFLGHGLVALTVQALLAPLATVVILVGLTPWKPGLPRRHAGTRPLLTRGLTIVVVHLVNAISSNVDQIALGKYHPAGLVGAYNRGLQISVAPLRQIMTPMTRLVVPRMSQAEGDIRTKAEFGLGAHGPVSLLCALGCGLIALNAPFVVRLALGGQWPEVAPIVAVLALSSIINASASIYYWLLVATTRVTTLFWSEFWPRLAMIASILIVARWGAVPVAVCILAGNVLMVVSACLYAVPKTGLSSRFALGLSLRWTWGVLVFAVAGLVAEFGLLRSLVPDTWLGQITQLVITGLLLLASSLLSSDTRRYTARLLARLRPQS